MPITFRIANSYLPWVVLIGIALGIANFSLGFWPTLGQSIFQQIGISLIIGYGTLLVVTNFDLLFSRWTSKQAKYIALSLLFVALGVIGSEMDSIIQRYVFNDGAYIPFSNGGAYIFNAIMSSVIGWATYQWLVVHKKSSPDLNRSEVANSNGSITKLPIKKGETISLHPLEDVTYFEAYDNYAFLYNMKGEKILTNNSLLELEQKLGEGFIRVHRKYLINRDQILKIQPHLKGRYSITFKDTNQSVITSSASYGEVIKGIIKI